MTIRIELTPQEEATLREQAAQEGTAAEQLITDWVRDRLRPESGSVPGDPAADPEGVRTSAVQNPPEELNQHRESIRAMALVGEPPVPFPDDWKKSVGMLGDDVRVEAIYQAGRRFRRSQRDD